MKKEVQDFYDDDTEREVSRFDHPLGLLEYSTGKHLIGKYLPGAGGICDIGAGPGKYSDYLCNLGYEVTLVDISSKLLEGARRRLHKHSRRTKDFVCASATDLSMFSDSYFDHCLMMGPMYHLTKKTIGDERCQSSIELSSQVVLQ